MSGLLLHYMKRLRPQGCFLRNSWTLLLMKISVYCSGTQSNRTWDKASMYVLEDYFGG